MLALDQNLMEIQEIKQMHQDLESKINKIVKKFVKIGLDQGEIKILKIKKKLCIKNLKRVGSLIEERELDLENIKNQQNEILKISDYYKETNNHINLLNKDMNTSHQMLNYHQGTKLVLEALLKTIERNLEIIK